MNTALHRRMLMLVLGAALTLGVAFLLPRATSAAPPEPYEESYTVTDECDFPVLVEISGKSKTKEMPGGNETRTGTPGARATFTNLDDPANQVTLGISGTVRVTELANGDTEFVWTGRNLLSGPDTDFIVIIGRFTGVVTAAGEFSPITGNGKIIDICARLE
jgi:hypothetical protein